MPDADDKPKDLDELVNQAAAEFEADPDHHRWAYGVNMRGAERAHDQTDAFAAQVNYATIQSGQLALRMSMLINGGAAVSVLAFLGSLAGKADISEVAPVTATMHGLHGA